MGTDTPQKKNFTRDFKGPVFFPFDVLHTDNTEEVRINTFRGFPGGAVVKNPPANAGDMGSSPDPGRPHMPQSN